MSPPNTRLVALTKYEAFWLDVIRLASGGAAPKPTLARTQQLRLLFATRSDRAPGTRP